MPRSDMSRPTTNPSILLVGAHRECLAPFEFLVANHDCVGMVTLTTHGLATMSAGTDLGFLAEHHGVSLHRTEKINDDRTIQWMRKQRPDLTIVIGWTQLLGGDALSIARLGTLGFHASLLPSYRGRAPINWALINGETRTGNTMMLLAPGVDAGDIVDQRVIAISDDDDCETLYAKVSETEVEMLRDLLVGFDGQISATPQDHSKATLMPRRRPEDGRVDWAWPTRRIFNWIRALTKPYPGAFSSAESTTIRIWRSSLDIAPEAPAAGDVRPGTIICVRPDSIVVQTGDGQIALTEVAIDGESSAALPLPLTEGDVLS